MKLSGPNVFFSFLCPNELGVPARWSAVTWLSTPSAISPFTALSCFVARCKYSLTHLTTGLKSGEHKRADDALSGHRLQGINAPRCPTATPSVHPWPRTTGQPQGIWLRSLRTCNSPMRYPEPERTPILPQGQKSRSGAQPGPTWEERLLGSGLEGSRLREYMHSAAWGLLRLELKEPWALLAGGVWRTKAHVPPPPTPGTCAVALFGPHCLGAGRWRCPRQVGRGKSLSTRPLQMASSHPPPGSAEQLLWVTRAVAMGYPTEEVGACVGWQELAAAELRPMGWGWGWAIKKAQVRDKSTLCHAELAGFSSISASL